MFNRPSNSVGVFSDDMDGLRKVPDNVPNPDFIAGHLQMPLTQVPDPFGTHSSFGAHNNARLQVFLDSFGLIMNSSAQQICTAPASLTGPCWIY